MLFCCFYLFLSNLSFLWNFGWLWSVLSRNTVRVVEIARDLCILKSPRPFFEDLVTEHWFSIFPIPEKDVADIVLNFLLV